MEYENFDQIDLPNLTVTQPNPSHVLDFRRFSSDQVISFNRLQTDIIKSYSDAPIAHNFMGKTTEFDHFKVGEDLDIASWDSYPLGFLEDRVIASSEFKQALHGKVILTFRPFITISTDQLEKADGGLWNNSLDQ